MFYVHLYLIPMYRCCISTYSMRGSCTEAAGNLLHGTGEQKQRRLLAEPITLLQGYCKCQLTAFL